MITYQLVCEAGSLRYEYMPKVKNVGYKADSKRKVHFVLPKNQKHADKWARTVSV